MPKPSCANCANRVLSLAICREDGGICDDHAFAAPQPKAVLQPYQEAMYGTASGHEARTEMSFQRARGKVPQWLLADLDRAREDARMLRRYVGDLLKIAP